jgi:hypothetical protein
MNAEEREVACRQFARHQCLYRRGTDQPRSYHCGAEMFRFPYHNVSDHPNFLDGVSFSGPICEHLDRELIDNFISDFMDIYKWNNLHVSINNHSLYEAPEINVSWKSLPDDWHELYIALSVLRLITEYPGAVHQYFKLRKFAPKSVAFTYAPLYDCGVNWPPGAPPRYPYPVTNHIILAHIGQLQHLKLYTFRNILDYKPKDLRKSQYPLCSILSEMYGASYTFTIPQSAVKWPLELTEEWYDFLVSQGDITDLTARSKRAAEFLKK